MKSAAVAGAALGNVGILHAQAKKPMNAVVIGCGGRGSGAGKNFLDACKAVGVEGKIVAVADVFEEKAKRGMKNFELPESKCFSGFDSYVKAINEPGVNYVIIATPPGFKAAQFKAAIEAGKHVFIEKPVAVDGPSARIMYAAGELADKKGLKVSAGTQRRHQAGYIDTIKRIHDGVIGDMVALRAYWVNGGPIWHRGEKGETDLEKQINNWYHYIWLCGDHICEQHVHNIDVCNWIMKDHPIKVWGQGSRQQLGDKSGEIWDNFDCEFEYASGARMFSYCGQIKRSKSSVSEAVHGTKGTSNPSGSYTLYGQKDSWKSEAKGANPYEQEHIDLINAILNNTELNETKNVTDSTLTAIMGREASYSGAEVTWDQILNSEFKYGPDLLYTDAHKMAWGAFRTLKPPMPSQYNIFKKPAEVPVA
jgi:predicted dehydrogenase